MGIVTRRIGLSLGADICWAKAYEDILERLDLALPLGRDTVKFQVERTSIVPFHLRAEPKYDVVVDRLTHWFPLQREWIKKAILLDGTYVLNNPWTVQSMEKHTSYCAMIRLGLSIPATAMIPAKDYEEKADLRVTLSRYAKFFDLGKLGEEIGYPAFSKPYDGGGWQGVSKVDDAGQLTRAYDASGKMILHLQAGVVPYDLFVRCIGFGPQTHVIKYDPSQPLHQRYTNEQGFLSKQDRALIEDITLTINAFFGWDFNSCEALLKDHVWHPIDFANPCPDSQVTSLHRHFPWLVKSYLRWSLFCAATKRPMTFTPDWKPYFAIADKSWPLAKKIKAYGRLARAHFDAEAFRKFCDKHLARLDDVVNEYFGTDDAKSAVRQKVAALFPEHEVERFTEHFWAELQAWRAEDAASRAPHKRRAARTAKVVLQPAKSRARAAVRTTNASKSRTKSARRPTAGATRRPASSAARKSTRKAVKSR
ncbi:MAG: hypothetical protein JNK02_17645 [Planctomycetes bacterium]|nr:hypothetical protein [Planctomycetota bacterium]